MSAALTHGRHCSCSACAREDWTKIAAPCGMHGASCPAVYAPIAASLREEAMRRVDRRYDHTLDECKVPDIHRAEYAEEEKSLREVEGPSAAYAPERSV